MSTYLNMWRDLLLLTPAEAEQLLDSVTPCHGDMISLRREKYLDIDIAEALRYLVKEKVGAQ